MDTALPQKFPFILDKNLAKANCTENHLCTFCDIVVLGFRQKIMIMQKKDHLNSIKGILYPKRENFYREVHANYDALDRRRWQSSAHFGAMKCTIASKINVTLKGEHLPITKLHSILAVANLLAHNKISLICYCGRISLQSAAVNSSFSDNLTALGVTFILLAIVQDRQLRDNRAVYLEY